MSDAVTVSLFLVDKVLSFLQEELSRDEKLLSDVKGINDHLHTMQAYLQDAEGSEGSTQIMRDVVKKIQDVAHEMEDVLDDFMIHAPRAFSATSFLQKGYQVCHHIKHRNPVKALQSNIASINARMKEITSSSECQALVWNIVSPAESSHHHPLGRYNREEEAAMFEDDDHEIIGIDSPKDHLISLLTERSSRRKAISVVGPSGAGKTVLVSSVYKSKRVIGQFDCHAWLTLSHTDNPEQHLQNVLSQFCMGIKEPHSPLGANTAMKLENYLVDKRYLVVLDGIRKPGEWSSIKRAMPDRFNGSRMIITTQSDDVAQIWAEFDHHILRVNGLTWGDSWRLFCKKAYRDEKCPSELQVLSQMIVKRCEGLPQPISAVGTLLSRKQRRPEEWSRVHDNLAAEMQANCINTMFLQSYYDLPSNQKSCLLYFSLFPEDYSIKRERLIRLWLSEGFIDTSGTVSPQHIAEDTLNELISRNLVDASSRDFRGRVKSCRVLNLMREFICQKSMEKKFAAVVTDRHMHQRDETIHRRLSIENASSSLGRTGGLHLDRVRSLFMFGLDTQSTNMIVGTLQRIRLLKVLDLENAPLDRFPECILDAALLRYLSLRNTDVDKIPKTIERLRYLEYLNLKQTQVTWLPEEIFSLHYLQHLLVYRRTPMNYEAFNRLQGVQIAGEMRVLPFIQKLSIIKVDINPRFFEILRLLTRLKKLGLTNLREKDGLSLCLCIKNMEMISSLDLTSSSREENLDLKHMNLKRPELLQHLYLKGRLADLSAWILSCNGLARLLLRGSRLKDSPTECLQRLPNLMELEMSDAFTGVGLFIDTGGFPNLRTLHIEQFEGLDTIAVYNGGLPMLRKLTIVRCMRFFDLPHGIQALKDLEELLLYDMPSDFISNLGRNSQERWKIDHVPIIHSFYVNANNTWGFQNFS